MAYKLRHLLLRCMAKKVGYPWDTNIDPSAYFSLLSSKGPPDKTTLTRAAAGWKLNIEKACTSRKLRCNCISEEANTSLDQRHTEQRSFGLKWASRFGTENTSENIPPASKKALGRKAWEKQDRERSLKFGWWGQKKKENFVENWIEKLRVQANIFHGKRLLLEF